MLPTGQILACNKNHNLYLINRDADTIQIGKPSLNYTKAGFAGSNNSVYVFGNSIAAVFDLKALQWKDLAFDEKLSGFSSTSCIEYQNKIIIADFSSSGILIYDIIKNSYSEVKHFYIKQNCYKLILKGNGRLFLIEFGLNIYESKPRDPQYWKTIETNKLPNRCIESSICQYKGGIYFLVNSQLWKFNLKPKNIELVDDDPFRVASSFQIK